VSGSHDPSASQAGMLISQHSVWSFYLGQPFRMSMKGVTLDKPGYENRMTAPGHWTPYAHANTTQSPTPMVDCVEEVCRQQVLLFEALGPLSDTL
jgi:hypothetical protein